MSKKKKSNLVVLHIYKKWLVDEFVIVLYKSYLNVMVNELCKENTNVFDTGNWKTLLDINDEYDSHVYINYNCLKLLIQNMYDSNNLKEYITDIIQKMKMSEKNYKNSYEENYKHIILQSINDYEFVYEGHLTKKEFKEFILYLMKEYKVDTNLAFSFYKEGLNTGRFSFGINKLYSDIYETLKRIYKSNAEVKKLERQIFIDFLSRKKKNKN